MLGWAYANVITKDFQATNSFQINFHNSILFTVLGGTFYFLYENHASFYRMGMGLICTGIALSMAQTLFVGAITLSK